MLWSDLTLDPSFKVKLLWPNFKVPISRLSLVLEVWDVKTTYRKTCAGNLLMSDLTLGPSFKVKRQCPNLKVPISHLLLVLLFVKRGWPSCKVSICSLLLLPEVWDVKLTLTAHFCSPAGDHTTAMVLLAIENTFTTDKTYQFIALIHLNQWTILLVLASPVKCQKKTTPVSPSRTC